MSTQTKFVCPKCACQMTMGEWGNYFECGRPAKFTIQCRMRGRLLVCGIHAKGKKTARPFGAGKVVAHV